MAVSSNSTGLPRSKFMEALLEPLPDNVLVDTHYNSLMRQMRQGAWARADAKTDFLEAKLKFKRAEGRLARTHGNEPEHERSVEFAIVDEYRAAIAAQMLVPAPDQAAVKWKKRAAQDRYIPIARDAIERAIAADEAWLAAHPVACRRKKSTD